MNEEIKKKIYSVLSNFYPTYQYNVPDHNEEVPVCIYYIYNEMYRDVWDDKQVNKLTFFTVKFYSNIDDNKTAKQIEEAIKNTFKACYLQQARQRKEDVLFLFEFDFELITH